MVDKKEIKGKILQAIEEGDFKPEVKKISLFGSFLKGNPQKNSDVDLLIEFMPKSRIGYFKFVGIQGSFEHCLGRKVDLLTSEALSKYFRMEVLQEAETIYER
jgi:hypothetical protein